tara:strand:- start:1102 stop:1320 length:219 start_codon:yes stop_codon:yes gene_type:complete
MEYKIITQRIEVLKMGAFGGAPSPDANIERATKVAQELEKKVNAEIKNGWKPIGGPLFSENWVFMQAMIKRQ